MQPTGQHLIAGAPSRQGTATFAAADPATGAELSPTYVDATTDEIERAMTAAATAARALRANSDGRAALLDAVARRLEELGDDLIAGAAAETGLPLPRFVNERGRTAGQLRMFAELLRQPRESIRTHDAGKPDLRRGRIALGPVVVFGASNFPLAFSVAGGDTAAALAAGCPVVVKGHPHHPATSERVGAAITAAVAEVDLPPGAFSLLHGRGHEVGSALVQHPLARAVAFTGSFEGGRALQQLANARAEPIPVFAEMGSVNPLFLLPTAVRERGANLAKGLADSIVLGVGQFCTNPGLVFVHADAPAADTFCEALQQAITAAPVGTTLHAGIAAAYEDKLRVRQELAGVTRHGGPPADTPSRATPTVLLTDAATFAAQPMLADEVFGPCSTVVRCSSADELLRLAETLPGQLTAGVHAEPADHELAARLLPILEDKAGRLVFNGYPTGVEVCAAMQHGGPWPATTDARFTSVGSAAIERFLRPVCYQDWPAALLPPEHA
ncbi:MAG: aldehyde dehydrogenase (NADP(+)) [Planctomycetota bacterium]